VALRAIVFDFDGVIANSEPLHFRAFRDVLAGEGIDLTERAYYERYLGFDDRGVFATVGFERGRSWSGDEVGRLVSRKALRLEEIERDVSVIFPGAADAIRRTAAVVPIAIASGALGPEIRRILDHADLTHYFSAIVSAEDTPASKPAPDPYQKVIGLLAARMDDASLLASECVAIEDSRWGLESARAAGLRTVGVTSSYAAAELALADLIIPSLVELNLEELRRLLS
jgi:beta-phosphoglucomutase-like phosphatase (HAD superfamily)